jgi:hypothetical protein
MYILYSFLFKYKNKLFFNYKAKNEIKASSRFNHIYIFETKKII